jgi:RimJ/RimL family protein N-acetyltransferase
MGHAPEDWSPEGKAAIGFVDGDDIRIAVLYDHYNVGSIQMHVAIDDPKYVTRRAIATVFEYPFNQLRVKKVLGMVNSENAAALTLDMRLGFKLEAIVEDVYETGDLYVLSMTREQCHWLRGKKDGRFSIRAAAA